MLLINFVFISVISLLSNFLLLFWPSLASHRGRSFPAIQSGTPQDLAVRYAEIKRTLEHRLLGWH
jgi:hypothetical protein